jgi:serine phosphatase RsbU (regulator of sigma subunit)
MEISVRQDTQNAVMKRKDFKVLVVDDSRLNRTIIKNTLTAMRIDVTEAADGLEGLDILFKNRFDLVIVDFIMPNLDGYGFIDKFRKKAGDNFIPVIMMTGSEDLKTKIDGLNIGADDFLQKPINISELKARVISLLRLKSAHDELYNRNIQIKKELDMAKRIQQFIIPNDFSFIKYPKVTGRYLPIEDIGGDFFDCYKFADNTGFIIADVIGHGIPAALVMTMSRMMFSIYSTLYASPSMLMMKVNSEMCKLLLDVQYISAFYMIYNRAEKIIRFTNAGHVRPLYYRAKMGQIIGLDTEGLFIGIMDENKYEEKSINIEKGDRIILYTDGITELRNSERVEYSEKRLAKFIIDNSRLRGEEFCEALINDMNNYTPIKRRSDDIAFLCIDF